MIRIIKPRKYAQIIIPITYSTIPAVNPMLHLITPYVHICVHIQPKVSLGKWQVVPILRDIPHVSPRTPLGHALVNPYVTTLIRLFNAHRIAERILVEV